MGEILWEFCLKSAVPIPVPIPMGEILWEFYLKSAVPIPIPVAIH